MAEVIERGRTEQVGAAAGRALAISQSKDLPAPCEKPGTLTLRLPMPPLKMPSSVAEAKALAEWAASVPAVAEPVTKDELIRKLEFMQSVLPSRAVDLQTGKDRVAVYVSRLMRFSEAATAHMARRACDELHWFPTVRWCVEAAESHSGEQADRQTALALVRRYHQAVMNDWMMRLRRGELAQANVDSAPPRWCAIAETQGLLRKDGDGRFLLRAKAVAA